MPRQRWTCPRCNKEYFVPKTEGLTICPNCKNAESLLDMASNAKTEATHPRSRTTTTTRPDPRFITFTALCITWNLLCAAWLLLGLATINSYKPTTQANQTMQAFNLTAQQYKNLNTFPFILQVGTAYAYGLGILSMTKFLTQRSA